MSDGPRYYRVSPKFWSDPVVMRWSDDAKLLALYLLTCEHRTTEGLFLLKKKYVEGDLEWSAERLAEPFGELLEGGFIEYDETAQICLIVNALRYQAPENENQAKNAVKRLVQLPPSPLTSTFKQLVERYSKWLAKQLPEGYGKPQSQSQAQSPPRKPSPTENGRARSPSEEIAHQVIEKVNGFILRGESESVAEAYQSAFEVAWQRAARADDADPMIASRAVLAGFFQTMLDRKPDGTEWGLLTKLVKSYGLNAFQGLHEALAKAPEDWYPYARGVCRKTPVGA